jgi:peptide/nickel transport system substrate-binding protein
MSEISPQFESNSQNTSAPRRMRWQVILLIAGLVMIVGAAAFMIIWNGIGGGPSVNVSSITAYTEASAGDPRAVNPLLAVSQADRDLSALVFSGLTRLDDYGDPVPDLAQSWRVSSDGLIYVFTLRTDVRWQDGAPFTAHDVDFTMSLLRDNNFPGPAELKAFWRTVETYADDDHTVRFVLAQQLSSFPEYAGIGILPAHILGGETAADLPADAFNLAPVGTGRLMWAGYQKDLTHTSVTLRPFPAFYDPARRVSLPEIEMRFYPTGGAAFQSFSSGTLAVGGLDGVQVEAVLDSRGLNLYTARLPQTEMVLFNQAAPTRLPFFQDQAVRLALWQAVDREGLVAQFLPRQAIVANSTVLPGTWAANPSLVVPTYDPIAAAARLDGAGWVLEGGARAKDGLPLKFSLLVSTNNPDRQIGESIASQWRALGIDASVQALAPDQLIAKLAAAPGDQGRDFDAALVELSPGRLADPDPYVFWHQSSITKGQNFSGFSDRDISEALEIGRKDPNGVRRTEMYRNYQQWFLDKGAALLLFNPLYNYAVSCQIQNAQITLLTEPADRFRNMHLWSVLPPDQAAQFCGG